MQLLFHCNSRSLFYVTRYEREHWIIVSSHASYYFSMELLKCMCSFLVILLLEVSGSLLR